MKGCNQTYVNFDVEIALKSGDSALKSVFSSKLSFEFLKNPFCFVYKAILAGHTPLPLFTKSFL